MIHATITIGDIHLSLLTNFPLDTTQLPTYELHFLDIPTGEREEISFPNENDAILAFAAWLLADKVDFRPAVYTNPMRDIFRSNKFLP